MDLDDVRINYDKAVADIKLCAQMMETLEPMKNEAIFLAYLGGLQTIWAKHTIVPLSKLNTFNKGKKNIEAAIKKEPSNIEIKFIRLSVQKNAPTFLGYNSNIQEDDNYIKLHQKEISSPIVKNRLNELLKR